MKSFHQDREISIHIADVIFLIFTSPCDIILIDHWIPSGITMKFTSLQKQNPLSHKIIQVQEKKPKKAPLYKVFLKTFRPSEELSLLLNSPML